MSKYEIKNEPVVLTIKIPFLNIKKSLEFSKRVIRIYKDDVVIKEYYVDDFDYINEPSSKFHCQDRNLLPAVDFCIRLAENEVRTLKWQEEPEYLVEQNGKGDYRISIKAEKEEQSDGILNYPRKIINSDHEGFLSFENVSEALEWAKKHRKRRRDLKLSDEWKEAGRLI